MILEDHATLQTIWTTVAHECDDAAPSDGTDPTDRSVNDLVRSAVLLQNALDKLSAVYDGAGASTDLHRLLDLVEKWLREVRPVLERMATAGDGGVPDWFSSVATWAADFVPYARRRLPRPGELACGSEDPDERSDRRWALHNAQKGLEEWRRGQKLLEDLDRAVTWRILGFEDMVSFEDHVSPRMHQLLKGKGIPAREMARRLLNEPTFSPAELASEGFRSALVMDFVNALVREQGAIWTSGHDTTARAELTATGRTLLTRLLAK